MCSLYNIGVFLYFSIQSSNLRFILDLQIQSFNYDKIIVIPFLMKPLMNVLDLEVINKLVSFESTFLL